MTVNVGIIGGGPSGITSAKYCSSYGLNPIIFEKSSQPGGLWIDGSQIWSTMYCNFTKYSMCFSDFPWPEDSSFHFAHRDQINDYLQSYIKHFDLLKYFKFNSRVDSIDQLENSKWKLKWTNLLTNESNEIVCDHIIVACGFNSIPNEPRLEDKQEFKGLVMHSCEYKTEDLKYKDKRVLVVGSSNSSVEISSDLVGYAKSVINLFRRPFWVIPKFIQKTETLCYPRDFVFYTRKFAYSTQNKFEKYFEICPEQRDRESCPPDLFIDETNKLPINFGVSEHFFRLVKEKKIETKRGEMKRFVSNGIELEDGSIIEADVVLFCTGYKLELPFFNQQLHEKIHYDKENYKNPIVLYKHTFHPSVKNLAFIFLTRGLFFIGLELQAKWTALVFSGKKEAPSDEEMKNEIEKNLIKRKNTHPSVQFPHGFYIEIIDELAKIIGCYPNFDDDLKEKFWNNLLLPSHFIYNENKELCLKMIENVEKLYENGVDKDQFC